MNTLEHDPAFDSALEDCCRRAAAGEPIDSCLADHPRAYRAELARLVPFALRIGGTAREPTAAFQARLEHDLLARVDAARRARRRGAGDWLGRLLPGRPLLRAATVALVALIVLFGGGVEVLQAAEDSLPDSPLYRVKGARESLRLLLTRDPESRVGVHANQIAQRGREMERAVTFQKSRPVVDVLALRLAASLDRIVDQAVELAEKGNPRPARRAHEAVQRLQAQLDGLATRAGPEARPALQGLRAELDRAERRLDAAARI
jgi:hypothetical protein